MQQSGRVGRPLGLASGAGAFVQSVRAVLSEAAEGALEGLGMVARVGSEVVCFEREYRRYVGAVIGVYNPRGGEGGSGVAHAQQGNWSYLWRLSTKRCMRRWRGRHPLQRKSSWGCGEWEGVEAV
ncbi:MAG: hypothetical protein RMM08_13545 [Armatimonadota bacterium]|nr:hypothetical protein [Armatimonadota bacterium]